MRIHTGLNTVADLEQDFVIFDHQVNGNPTIVGALSNAMFKCILDQGINGQGRNRDCLLYTSDAADDAMNV